MVVHGQVVVRVQGTYLMTNHNTLIDTICSRATGQYMLLHRMRDDPKDSPYSLGGHVNPMISPRGTSLLVLHRGRAGKFVATEGIRGILIDVIPLLAAVALTVVIQSKFAATNIIRLSVTYIISVFENSTIRIRLDNQNSIEIKSSWRISRRSSR